MTASTKRLKCNGSSIRILIENMDNQNCGYSENGQKLVAFYVYCRHIKESLFLKRMIQHFFFQYHNNSLKFLMNTNEVISVNENMSSSSRNFVFLSQQTFTCSNSTIETLEKDAKYVQSRQ